MFSSDLLDKRCKYLICLKRRNVVFLFFYLCFLFISGYLKVFIMVDKQKNPLVVVKDPSTAVRILNVNIGTN